MMSFAYRQGDSLAEHLAEALRLGSGSSMRALQPGTSPSPDSIMLFGTRTALIKATSGIRIVDPHRDTTLVKNIPQGCEKAKCHIAIAAPPDGKKAVRSRTDAIKRLPQMIRNVLDRRAKEAVPEEERTKLGWDNDELLV